MTCFRNKGIEICMHRVDSRHILQYEQIVTFSKAWVKRGTLRGTLRGTKVKNFAS